MPAPASAVGGLGPAVALLPSVGAGEAGPFEEEETGRTQPRRLASEHAADAFGVNTRRIKTVCDLCEIEGSLSRLVANSGCR